MPQPDYFMGFARHAATASKDSTKMVKIIGFRTNDGYVQPVAWSDRDVSKSEAKRIVSKFRNEPDFTKHVVTDATRLYSDPRDARRELPKV